MALNLNIVEDMERATQLHRAGKLAEAQGACERILRDVPDYLGAIFLLGVIRHQLGDQTQAEAWFRRVVALNSDMAEAHCNLGAVLRAQRRWEEAAECYRKALARRSDYAAAHQNLADVLNQLGQYEEARKYGQAAVGLEPAMAEAWNTLGNILYRSGDGAAAEQHYRTALRHKPGLALAHFNLAVALLARGEFAEGWKEYEWRLALDAGRAKRWEWVPRWGGEALGGRGIVLYADQGDGDTMQFVRYVPLVQQRGGRIVVECSAAAARLIRSMSGVEVMVAGGDVRVGAGVAVQCPLGSLPEVIGTTAGTIPEQVPYLRAQEADLARWGQRMALEPAGLRVGLVWAGSPHHAKDALRSIPLRAFDGLLAMEGVRFYSLQKGEAAAQARELAGGRRLVDWHKELTDFAETAAVVAGLDVVITVDTAVAHLAGALDKPTWVLLHDRPDWRWGHAGATSAWYPTMRLFRQARAGDWQGVITEVGASLRDLAKKKAER
jgi:tetratricopeptide (TPR) repeat protein